MSVLSVETNQIKTADWAPSELVKLLARSPNDEMKAFLKRVLSEHGADDWGLRRAWAVIEELEKPNREKNNSRLYLVELFVDLCGVYQKWQKFKQGQMTRKKTILAKLDKLCEAATVFQQHLESAGDDYDLTVYMLPDSAQGKVAWGLTNHPPLHGMPSMFMILEEYIKRLNELKSGGGGTIYGVDNLSHADAEKKFVFRELNRLMVARYQRPKHATVAALANAIMQPSNPFSEKNVIDSLRERRSAKKDKRAKI